MTLALARHPLWRQLLVISVALPVVIVVAVLAFAWPAARIAPRDLPLGVVGTDAATQQAAAGLARARPGAFELRRYGDESDARRGIEDREVYGALVLSPGGATMLTASAASPTVAQLLGQLAQSLPGSPRTVDVVPTAAEDPRGVVLSSALLPLTLCSVVIAAAVALLLRLRPAWRQLLALSVVSATAGLGAYLVAGTYLGALPGDRVATWAAVSLTILAMCAGTAGFIALLGRSGLALGGGLMVFLGNPFSGSTSAPELLPDAVQQLGRSLPPGAGTSLIRGAAYFGGHGAGSQLGILLLWVASGFVAVVLGQHTALGNAARRERAGRHEAPVLDAAPAGAGRPALQSPGR